MDNRKQVNLIGISGRIGSGKDTFAKMIQLVIYNNVYGSKHPCTLPTELALRHIGNVLTSEWQIKKFADKLKEIVCILIGCTRDQLEDQKFKDSVLPREWGHYERYSILYEEYIRYEGPLDKISQDYRYYLMTVRKLLQLIGTEAMRNNVHQSIWINALFSSYHINPPNEKGLTSKWIITDVRFPDEAQVIHDRGGILLRMDRQYAEVNRGQLHASETSLDHYERFDHIIPNTGTLEQLYEDAKFIVDKYKLK